MYESTIWKYELKWVQLRFNMFTKTKTTVLANTPSSTITIEGNTNQR